MTGRSVIGLLDVGYRLNGTAVGAPVTTPDFVDAVLTGEFAALSR